MANFSGVVLGEYRIKFCLFTCIPLQENNAHTTGHQLLTWSHVLCLDITKRQKLHEKTEKKHFWTVFVKCAPGTANTEWPLSLLVHFTLEFSLMYCLPEDLSLDAALKRSSCHLKNNICNGKL